VLGDSLDQAVFSSSRKYTLNPVSPTVQSTRSSTALTPTRCQSSGVMALMLSSGSRLNLSYAPTYLVAVFREPSSRARPST